MLKARFFLIFAALAWGSSFVATKICLRYLTPVELMAIRFAIALPVLFAIISINRVRFNLGKSAWTLLWASGIIAAHFFIQITGIKYTSATNTGWIISITPLIVIVLAYFFLRERIGIRTILAICLAFAGVLLLISKGNLASFSWLRSTGDWLVLASAFTWAIYTILTRDISRLLNPLLVTFVVLLPSAVLTMGIVLFHSNLGRFLYLPLEAYISLLFLGIIGTAIAHWFWQNGVARLGASRAGVFLYLEPIATTSVAVTYLHEDFGLFTALGGILVLSGVWIAQIKAAK